MRQALVFGASGQIGVPLVSALRMQGWQVHVVSRVARPDAPGLRWLHGTLGPEGFVSGQALPARVDAVFSCGPLDHFANWHAQGAVMTPRVVAFGSTSLQVKRDSPDPDEQALAARLALAEQTLFATAAAAGTAVTVLRPTLIYGRGVDRSLSRIAMQAKRFGRFALPRGATGLRQPVHADDLAGAALRCLHAPATHGQAYALPGGETLPYREMVARTLAALDPPLPLHLLPMPLFRLLVAGAQLFGVARDFGPATLARLGEDLVFDAGPAQRDLGYTPRTFTPTAAMFAPPQPEG